jgi:hypothetical protein
MLLIERSDPASRGRRETVIVTPRGHLSVTTVLVVVVGSAMGCGSSTPQQNGPPAPGEITGKSVSFINHDGPSPPPSAPQDVSISFSANKGTYGKNKFKGVEADSYLKKVGLTSAVLEEPGWTRDAAKAEKVAKAVCEWARAHGEAPQKNHPLEPSLEKRRLAGVARGAAAT